MTSELEPGAAARRPLLVAGIAGIVIYCYLAKLARERQASIEEARLAGMIAGAERYERGYGGAPPRGGAD